MKPITTIGVKGSFYAYHRWKDAPEDKKFLKEYHPHTFFVEVEVEVNHNGRDVEFFDFKEQLHEVLSCCVEGQSDNSCEDFCQMIYNGLCSENIVAVTVSEDGMNYGRKRFK